MRKITAFLFTTVNGCYRSIDHDTSWHRHGEEGTAYSEKQLESDDILLFGRKTYEMMAAFWPSPMAYELFPKVAEGMNKAAKIVVSNSLKKTDWSTTVLMSGDIISQIKKLKQSPGKNITLLGSGELANQLTAAGLIDEYLFLIDPVAIGNGVTLFEKLGKPLELKLTDAKIFPKSGSVLLSYAV